MMMMSVGRADENVTMEHFHQRNPGPQKPLYVHIGYTGIVVRFNFLRSISFCFIYYRYDGFNIVKPYLYCTSTTQYPYW